MNAVGYFFLFTREYLKAHVLHGHVVDPEFTEITACCKSWVDQMKLINSSEQSLKKSRSEVSSLISSVAYVSKLLDTKTAFPQSKWKKKKEKKEEYFASNIFI